MWNSSNYGNDLNITKAQAESGSHAGACDGDIAGLRTLPQIRRQLAKLEPENLRLELTEYGAWDEQELADHEANLLRWLWISCGDIIDQN